MKVYFSIVVADAIRRAFHGRLGSRVLVDQHQNNNLFCIHQLRARVQGDDRPYRILIAPADAPITVGGLPIDQHFLERIDDEAKPAGALTGAIVESLERERA